MKKSDIEPYLLRDRPPAILSTHVHDTDAYPKTDAEVLALWNEHKASIILNQDCIICGNRGLIETGTYAGWDYDDGRRATIKLICQCPAGKIIHWECAAPFRYIY